MSVTRTRTAPRRHSRRRKATAATIPSGSRYLGAANTLAAHMTVLSQSVCSDRRLFRPARSNAVGEPDRIWYPSQTKSARAIAEATIPAARAAPTSGLLPGSIEGDSGGWAGAGIGITMWP